MTKKVSLLAAVGLVTAAITAAQEPPKPAAELDQLKMFVGHWTCDGKAPASPLGPERVTKTHAKITREHGGFWYVIHFGEEKSKDNPATDGVVFWGYDPSTKKFIGPGVDSMGGWFHETSAGWEGNKLNWQGDGMMMGKKMAVRDFFEKKSDSELTHAAEVEIDGKWVKVGDETCKKAAAAAPAKK